MEIELAIARGAARQEDHDQMIYTAWNEIFPSTEFQVDQEAYPSAAIYELVKRACIELEKRALGRLRDDRRHRFFDGLFDPAAPPAVTVQQLSEQLLAMRREEGIARRLSPKTIDKQSESLALVREILGDDTLVRNIGFDECQRFRSTLSHVPPNRTKLEAVQVRWFEALKMKTRRATVRTPVGSDLPFAARMVAT